MMNPTAVSGSATPLTIISSTTVDCWSRSDLDVVDSGSGTASAWGDQTANNLDWLQGGASSIQPTITAGGPGGKQFLAFDGVDDFMTNTFAPNLGFWWIVCRRNDTAAERHLINGTNAGTRRQSLYQSAAGSLRMANSTQGNIATNYTSGSTWYFIWANFTGSTSDEIKVGSGSIVTGTSANSVGAISMWLGCKGDLTLFTYFDVLEIGHCAAKPDAGELSALTGSYTTDTWGGVVQV